MHFSLNWKCDIWWHQFFIFPDFSKKKYFPFLTFLTTQIPTFSSFPWPVGTLRRAYVGWSVGWGGCKPAVVLGCWEGLESTSSWCDPTAAAAAAADGIGCVDVDDGCMVNEGGASSIQRRRSSSRRCFCSARCFSDWTKHLEISRLAAYWPAPIHAVAHCSLYCRHVTSA